ncbi:hypothetical protein KXW29_007152 [Aspergillus fumigatus]|uniref:PHP domain protein n=1 Tax=Aspergillus fumigatus (strain ATCC MYA-4609 / CBS 101355 / FGSC A1100 / Af293) TaxID=330879 RepID=Q4WE33_ASPFU|nr:PHP domain protein [Aspergillus fumigatus Af293]EAL86144.1 PHP domain protein [Aspergillus fumigatus Af293]KAH1422836.1 hypothetical protein KXX32_007512 [Aspergillus fumigatus]KAH2284947.1 hypothetical protein KXW02_002212 [Aspergillus fumigatus]KAH2729117.1 hypothetical protein KXW29_007152 [Aspergillus fumigatus]
MKHICSIAWLVPLLELAIAARAPIKKTLTGHIDPSQVFSFVYVPFEVEVGTTSIYVVQNYSNKGRGNALDLGVFDQRGYQMMDAQSGTTGSRGWSGGFRNNFTITPTWATPGYNPGAIEPGIWNVVLGPYESVPDGIDWQLDIEMSFDPVDSWFAPDYATTDLDPLCNDCQEDSAFIWLRGDFHMHTVYSDGKYTPDQQIHNALAQNLSFIFFSDHNTDTSNQIIGAYQASLAPDLLVGRAIEVTTRSGHWQAVGLDRGQIIEWRYKPDDNPGFAAAAHQVHRVGGFVSANHPFATCPACNWSLGWEETDAVEVWNAQWDEKDQQAVQKWQELLVDGKFLTAIGGSDSHSPPSLNGWPTTIVKARGRSQAAIVEGVKAGRAYLVQGPGMDLTFEVRVPSLDAPAQIGDKVRRTAAGAKAVLVTDGMSKLKACFVSDKGYFYNTTIEDGVRVKTGVLSGARFVRVEVRNGTTDEVLALTSPVWFLGP